MFKFFKPFLFVSLFLFFFFSCQNYSQAASGASLYFSPANGTYAIGSDFTISIKVDTNGQIVNAVEGSINFDGEALEFVSATRSGSIFSLWTTEPSLSGSNIIFGGGIPASGYSGAAGQVCNVTFRAKKVGPANIRFSSGAALINDGKGTNVLVSMGSGGYVVSPLIIAPPMIEGKETLPLSGDDKKDEKKEVEIVTSNGSVGPVINSDTHVNQNVWYGMNRVKFNWDLPLDATGVSFSFNEEAVADPGQKSEGLVKEKEYSDIENGIHYFHLKFKNKDGWSAVAHYRVMIDVRPPETFTASIEDRGDGNWPVLHFNTKDGDSGLDKYEIIVGSLEEKSYDARPEDSFLEMRNLEVGDHTAMVRAIDKAGNERISVIDFKIHPIESPEIQNYLTELRSSDSFYLNGTALPNAMVTVFIQREGGLPLVNNVQADGSGKWFYVHSEKLENGRYAVWTEVTNEQGVKSNPTSKLNFLVSPPILLSWGNVVVSYFTVLVSIIALATLVVVSIIYLISLVRRKLRVETGEVEQVLHSNFSDLRKSIDQEFIRLKKYEQTPDYKAEKEKMRLRIEKKIKSSEMTIMKEVVDVEKILK